MKKFFIFCCCVVFISRQYISAQLCDDRDKISFTGSAPAPWAINGQVDDWQTILGPFTGNNIIPYNPPRASDFNWSTERAGLLQGDLDHPDPGHDLSFQAFTNDDYNVYFYFRKVNVTNGPGSFMYFLDIDHDGYMELGEPVIGAQYNGQHVGALTLYKFIPDPSSNYVAGKGNYIAEPPHGFMDGFTVSGFVEKVFTSNKLPVSIPLNNNEVFDVALTENGFGIELSIPWKYLRNYETEGAALATTDVFIYHLSLLKGGGPGYKAEDVVDNIGNCCKKMTASSSSVVVVSPQSGVQTSSPGSYKLHAVLQNLTNAYEEYSAVSLQITDIILYPGQQVTPSDITVAIYRDWNVNGIIDPEDDGVVMEPNGSNFVYTAPALIPIIAVAAPNATGAFIITINLAPGKISSMTTLFSPRVRFGGFISEVLSLIYCTENTGGGGKPINPIGFTLEESFESKPAKGESSVWLPAGRGNAEINVMTATGANIRSWSHVTNDKVVLNGLKPGIYFVRVYYPGSGKQYILKLISQ